MARLLIKEGRIVDQDPWRLTRSREEAGRGDAVIVPLETWLQHQALWQDFPGRLGLQLSAGDDLSLIKDALPCFELIAIEFPSFTDGRGYSAARLLVDQYHFPGEIRAVGDVFKDVLFYLARVGFNAFELRLGEDGSDALQAFKAFSEAYQQSVDRPEPLFRRRLHHHG